MIFALWLIVSTTYGVTTTHIADYSSSKDCEDAARTTQFVAFKGDGLDQTVTFVCIKAK
jgi:hypothetical protein